MSLPADPRKKVGGNNTSTTTNNTGDAIADANRVEDEKARLAEKARIASSESTANNKSINSGSNVNGASCDEVILATAGYDHTIKFWRAHTGECIRTLQHSDSQVRVR